VVVKLARKLHRTEKGFTYIGVLFAVALMGVTLALIATVTSQTQQRDKEKQLLFVGSQFQQAIASYYDNPPLGQVKQFPKKLEDLLQDNRTPFTVRHLRKIFFDPFTANADWGLIKDASSGIVGVYSKSEIKPIKVANFDKEFAQFENRKHYSDWKFIYATGLQQAVIAGQNSVETSIPPPEVIPPEYVPPPLPPTKPNTPDERRKRLCDSMHSNDLRTCFSLSKKFGDAAGATCLSSAASRYAACLNGEMLSPLAVQYK
jgi:type II secretory pathway pseudopilin PulG